MTKCLAALHGFFAFFALVGCASQVTDAAQRNLLERCRLEGKRPFVFESTAGGVPLLMETATIAGYCVGPENILHTNAAFGADLVGGGSEIHGAGVIDVYPHTIAQRAGIQAWDIIVEYAGQPIARPVDLTTALARTNAGDQVKIGFSRNKQIISTTAQF
jgi:predicted metalloprotease with PDZ domain